LDTVVVLAYSIFLVQAQSTNFTAATDMRMRFFSIPLTISRMSHSELSKYVMFNKSDKRIHHVKMDGKWNKV